MMKRSLFIVQINRHFTTLCYGSGQAWLVGMSTGQHQSGRLLTLEGHAVIPHAHEYIAGQFFKQWSYAFVDGTIRRRVHRSSLLAMCVLQPMLSQIGSRFQLQTEMLGHPCIKMITADIKRSTQGNLLAMQNQHGRADIADFNHGSDVRLVCFSPMLSTHHTGNGTKVSIDRHGAKTCSHHGIQSSFQNIRPGCDDEDFLPTTFTNCAGTDEIRFDGFMITAKTFGRLPFDCFSKFIQWHFRQSRRVDLDFGTRQGHGTSSSDEASSDNR
jgi:hypothetical protein